MELTEVVSPQIAIPVFGVVLCAVLVFVFGFKSPEQPPSFEFDEDSKKRRTRKSKLPKSQTNGHAIPVSVLSEDSAASKPHSSPRFNVRGSPPAKQLSPGRTTSGGKSDQNQKVESPKSEIQKKSDQAKKVKKSVSKDVVKNASAEDSEGWTTLVSRKEKKLRHKKDDKVEAVTEEKTPAVIPEVVKDEEVTIETEVETTPVQEQRNKKKNKKKIKELQVESSKGDNQEANSDPVGIESEKKAHNHEVVPDETGAAAAGTLETENEETTVTETESNNKKDIADEATTTKKSSKSKKNKKEKSLALGLDISADDDFVPPVITPRIEISSEVTTATDAQESQPTKTAKSPKKKKKQKVDNSVTTESKKPLPDNFMTVENASPSALPNVPDSKPDTTSSTNIPIIEKKSENVNKPIPESIEPETASPNTETSPGNESNSAQGATFDEMGDIWIEAKPKSKKKKARRDN
ncbi:hypothetical protein ScPMuIL_005293 [Solemya velum]